jgi:hypothetical protein
VVSSKGCLVDWYWRQAPGDRRFADVNAIQIQGGKNGLKISKKLFYFS